jgi:hypothetical protein
MIGAALAEMLQDPEFRAEWECAALARAVAEAVIRYRAGATARTPQRGHSRTPCRQAPPAPPSNCQPGP